MIQLRPSSSYKWTRCAASPTFEAASPPQPESDEAREGTCAAWVADQVLRLGLVEASDMIGEVHANGWAVTPDMTYHVQKFVDLIRSYGGNVSSEQRVKLTDYIQGTLDTSIAAEVEATVLRVKDLKFGMKIVEVFDNPQLLIYAGGELIRLGNPPSITRVELAIFQPRAFHPEGIHRTWTITTVELWERLNWIVARGEECQKPNPVATPGPQCDHCTGRGSCAALAMTNYANFERVVEDTRQRHMTADEIAAELSFLDKAERLIKARRSAVFDEGEARIRAGEFIAGWKLEGGKGHRAFTVPAVVVEALTGFKALEEPKMKTPAALEREGANPDIIAMISRAPDTAVKLKKMPSDYIAKAFNNGRK